MSNVETLNLHWGASISFGISRDEAEAELKRVTTMINSVVIVSEELNERRN